MDATSPTLLASEHVADIGGPGGIRKHRALQILRCEPVADGQGEDIDHLISMRPDQVRAQDPVALLFNEHLKSIDRFRDTTRGIPACCPLAVDLKLESVVARLLFAEARRRNRRDREGYARHSEVIGFLMIAVEHIGSDDFSVMTRNGSQRRATQRRIARRISCRAGDVLEKLISLIAGTGCVKLRLNLIRSFHAMVVSPAAMPLPRIRRE